MNRPHMRSIVCATAAGACICCGILVQAAGPIGFVSRIWKERPVILKTKESRLNPMNWFGGRKADKSNAGEAADDPQTLVRSNLTHDPFLTESGPESSDIDTGKTTDSTPPDSNITRAPLVVEQRTVLSATGLETAETPVAELNSATDPDTAAAQQLESLLPPSRPAPTQATSVQSPQQAPRLPELGVGSIESTRTVGQADRPAADAPQTQPVGLQTRQPDRGVRGNRFVGGFDAEFAKLVQSVIAETENGTVQAPTPRLPETGTPSANDASPSLVGRLPETQSAQPLPQSDRSGAPLLPGQPIQSSTASVDSTFGVSGVSSEFSMENERADFARYASQLTGQSVSDVIESSRRRIADTPLATRQNVTREQLTAGQGNLTRQVQPIDSTRPSIASDSQPDIQRRATMQITPGRAGSGFIIESPDSRPIQPRVTPNGAPPRSVPDHSEFERLSYQTDEDQHGDPLVDAADGPLLMLPNEHHPPGQHFLDPAESDADTGDAAAKIADSSANWWPNETDTAADEPGSGVGWVFAVLCLILTVIAAGYAARRKLQIDSFDITRIRQRFEKD